jgi:hypothetical protein
MDRQAEKQGRSPLGWMAFSPEQTSPFETSEATPTKRHRCLATNPHSDRQPRAKGEEERGTNEAAPTEIHRLPWLLRCPPPIAALYI